MDQKHRLNEAITLGGKAKALMEDPVLVDAFRQIEESLEERLIQCDARDTDALQDIARCKQLLVGLQRAIARTVQTGSFAIEELRIIEQQEKRPVRFMR